MIFTATVRAVHASDPDRLFHEAMDFAELRAAMAGLATYERLPEGRAEEGATYDVAVTLWGRVRTDPHVMRVERLDAAARRVQSREGNAMVRRWDHGIAIDPHPEGAVWTDTVVLDAGWRTPVVGLMCLHTYAYRHRRRGALRIGRRLRWGDRAA